MISLPLLILLFLGIFRELKRRERSDEATLNDYLEDGDGERREEERGRRG